MLIRILLNYILGYIRISVEGYYIERFINICRNNKIAIWNLKMYKNIKLELNIGIGSFKEIIKIAKKTKCRVKILKKRGMPFLLNRYRKRKIFFGLLILIFLFIFISSNFVWNIEIIEENNNQLVGIKDDIINSGLEIGSLKSKIDTKEVINKIRLLRNDIAWIGIQLKGTNAIVKLVKAEEKPEIIDDEDYCNIVSNKAGIITKISAKNGTAAVKVGDTVNVGTTLINGWMEGKYTGIRYVHAEGIIEAKVWYTESKKILYTTTEKQDTGNEEIKYKIKINNFEINLSKRVSKFKNYDTIDEEKIFKLFSDFYLPISVVKTTNKEVKEVIKKYDTQQAKNIGIQELESKLDKQITNKEKIINKIINTKEETDGLEVSITYEVLENIGTNEKIVF